MQSVNNPLRKVAKGEDTISGSNSCLNEATGKKVILKTPAGGDTISEKTTDRKICKEKVDTIEEVNAKQSIGYCCQGSVHISGSCFSLVESVVEDCQPRFDHISSPPLPLFVEGKDIRKVELDSD